MGVAEGLRARACEVYRWTFHIKGAHDEVKGLLDSRLSECWIKPTKEWRTQMRATFAMSRLLDLKDTDKYWAKKLASQLVGSMPVKEGLLGKNEEETKRDE